MKRTGPNNIHLEILISRLKKLSYTEKAAIWRRIADELAKPTRKRRVVNLSKINRYSKEDETVVVPGKVLGAGSLNHKLTIAAYSFSDSAKDSIIKTNGKALTIHELIEQNPKGKKVRIIG
jgi:large subunit ribosomal protein L18e